MEKERLIDLLHNLLSLNLTHWDLEFSLSDSGNCCVAALMNSVSFGENEHTDSTRALVCFQDLCTFLGVNAASDLSFDKECSSSQNE